MRTLLALALLLWMSSTAEAQQGCTAWSFVTNVGARPAAEFVPAVANKRIYICGVVLTSAGNAAGFQLLGGNGLNCATNTTPLTQVYELPTGATFVNRTNITMEYTEPGAALCALSSGTGTISATVYWAQF